MARLPPLPAGVDPRGAEAVPALLQAYVTCLPDRYTIAAAGLVFWGLVETEYPEAAKAYADSHWSAHWASQIRSLQSSQRSAARRRVFADVTARKANGEQVSILDTSFSVSRGRYARLRAMHRPEIRKLASDYQDSGLRRLVTAKFYRRIAAKLPNDTVEAGEFWSVDEIDALTGEVFGDEGPAEGIE